MALIERAFDIQNGISLDNKVGIFYSDISPNTNGSLDSPKGSLILQVPSSGEPQLWKKFGTGTTEWKKIQTKTYTSTGIPTTNNDGVDTAGIGITFEPGDLWINTNTSTGLYVCFKNTTGAALWGQAGGAVSFESSTANIKMDGTVSVGALSTVPRADHVHPSDTSKQDAHAIGNLTTSTGLLVSGGTGAVIGSGTVLSLPQLLGPNDSPTFVDVTLSSMHRTVSALGTDTKMATGIPFAERGKFKVSFTYSAPNIIATISFVGANTSFSYYINGKKFIVTSSGLSVYTKSATAAEGTWYFYINQTTTNVSAPDLSLSQTPWTIYDPDVLLWNAYFNATTNTITWVGEERHTAGRDIYNHARNHAQGAIYKSGLLFSQYNGLTAFSSNTDNNFGRVQTQISGGSFYDEDIQNTISHTDASITSTTSSPATGWNLTVNQFLGFTALATTGTNATTIVFTTTRTLATGQAVTVMTGNTTTVRGTTTITTGGTSTSFTVSSVTGLASGDAIVIGARIPIYYISAVAGGGYTWRKLASTDFLGVSGGVGITAATITTATCQYNDAAAGGFATVTANRYYPMYLIATNMTSEPVIAILGQGQSTNSTLATALGEAPFQFSNVVGLTGLGIQEAVPFYRLTYNYNTGGAFTNTRIKVVDVTFLNLRVSTVSGTVIGSSPSTMAASQVTTDTTNFSNILTTSETTVQAALDKIDDFQNTYATVANAEAATGVDNKLCYVVETETWYRYEETGSAYTDDNKWVLSTGDAGNTRWIGVAGKYRYFDDNIISGLGALNSISSGTKNTAIGYQALYSTTTYSYNTAIGYQAGLYSQANDNVFIGPASGLGVSGQTIGAYNVGIGHDTLQALTTGNYNFGMGYQSLYSLTTASYSIALGHGALYSLTTQSYNLAIGDYAGQYSIPSSTNSYNIYIGYGAGRGVNGQNTGYDNVAIGHDALKVLTSGYLNVALGYQALYNLNIGNLNYAIGYKTLFSLTSGTYNYGIGGGTLYSLTTQNYNIAIGDYAGQYSIPSTTNSCNMFIGYTAGRGQSGLSTGIANMAIGYQALRDHTSGSNNTAIGRDALVSNTTGSYNIGIGYQSMLFMTTQSYNVAIGDYAGYYSVPSSTNSYNLFIGYSAGYGVSGQSTGIENLAIGHDALKLFTTGNNNAAIGYQSLYNVTTGTYNCAIGYGALYSLTTQTEITAIGMAAGYYSTGGNSVFIGRRAGQGAASGCTGSYNTAIGGYALYSFTSGASNIAIGHSTLYNTNSGQQNTAIGQATMYSLTTGSYNVAIGYQTLYYLTTQSYSVAIGDFAGQYSVPSATNAMNIFIGYTAGQGKSTLSTGTYNTAIGFQALRDYTTGTNNTAIGRDALISISSGSYNTAIGYQTGVYLTTGNYNAFIGDAAGYSNKIGNDNINIGYQAGMYNTGSEQYAIGSAALYGVAPVYEVVQITVNSSTLANYVGDYFVLHSGINGLNAAARRGFWFDTTGSDAMPTFTADSKIKITITGLTSTGAIASAISTAIATDTTYFTTSSTTNVITVTYKLARENTLSTNGCSEITLTITTRGTGTNGELSNIAIGQSALGANTNGFGNIGIGRLALRYNLIGSYNTALGYQALAQNKFGNYNVAIGLNALYENIRYSDNVIIGYIAGRFLVGFENVAIGTWALGGMAGVQSVSEVTTITVNSATLANYSGDWFRFYDGLTTGSFTSYDFWFDVTGSDSKPAGANGTVPTCLNISACTTTAQIATVIKDAFNEYIYSVAGRVFSAAAPSNVVTVTHLNKVQNTDATGASASEITINVTTQGTGNSAYYSVAIGYYSQYSNTLGVQNTSIGHQTLRANTTGINNTAIGASAGYANTIGSNGVFIGAGAGQTATTVDSGIYIGYRAGLYSTGGSNTFIGAQAAQGVTGQTTATQSVAIGALALIGITTGTSNTVVGYQSFYTAATNGYNTALGWDTGYYTTSSYNTFVGYSAGMNVTSGANNVALGYQAGRGTGTPTWATGANNVSIGYNAGLVLTTAAQTVLIGASAGDTLTTGTNNIIIGFNADVGVSSVSNSIIIGSGISTSTGNQILIGNTSTGTAIVKGIYGNTHASNPYVRIGSDGMLYRDTNPPAGGGTYAEEIFTASAAQTNFSLANAPLAEASTWVFIDAAYSATDQYTLSTTTLILGTGLAGGEKVVIKYIY